MKDGVLKGNVKFDKAKLFIALNPLRSKGDEIKRKLDLFRDPDVESFSFESSACKPHIVKVEKTNDGYDLSLTKTIKVSLKAHEYLKLEEFLSKMADACVIEPTMTSPDSTAHLIDPSTPRSI